MARDVSALSGAHEERRQIPVSFVRMEISGAEQRIHDIDVNLFLNVSTGAGALVDGVGLDEFVPHAGLTVPQISSSDDDPLSEFSISLANQNGAWFPIIAANLYHGAAVTIWQANLSLPAGDSPWEATFTGSVKVWAGEIISIIADDNVATITIGPMDVWRMPIPNRYYTSPDFLSLPDPGTKVKWGYTVTEV